MMIRLTACLIFALATAAAAAPRVVSQTVKDETKELAQAAEIAAVQRDLTRGIGGEWAPLETLYTCEFTLTNANGVVRTRAQRLSMLRSGESRNVSAAREAAIHQCLDQTGR